MSDELRNDVRNDIQRPQGLDQVERPDRPRKSKKPAERGQRRGKYSDLRVPFAKIFELLQDADPEEQLTGWQELQKELTHPLPLTLNEEMVRAIMACIPRVLEGELRRLVFDTMPLVYAAMLRPAASEPPSPPVLPNETVGVGVRETVKSSRLMPRGSLGRWLWWVFRRASWLLRLVDLRQRDERAAIVIGRRLPWHMFSAARFREIRPGTFSLTPGTEKSLAAVAFIGRPSLFYAPNEPAERWTMSSARFRFSSAPRPADPHGQPLDPDYYCIYEFVAPEVALQRLLTRREGDHLTDFGLVQRFVATINGSPTVVLIIAGSTFAGTYAAACWAASEMFEDQLGCRPIPAPEGMDPQCDLEALVRVGTHLGEDMARLPPLEYELVDLRVRGGAKHLNLQWNREDHAWEKPSPNHVALVYAGDGADSPGEPLEVWLDGWHAPMRDDGVALRLLVAICRHAQASGGIVPYETLEGDRAIWETDRKVSRKDLMTHLRALKSRYLMRALELDPDNRGVNAATACKLLANVHIVTR
jgi:hypothetical protein